MPSISLPVRFTTTLLSSVPTMFCACAIGTSFVPVTVITKFAVDVAF